jgi:hypothetical protein
VFYQRNAAAGTKSYRGISMHNESQPAGQSWDVDAHSIFCRTHLPEDSAILRALKTPFALSQVPRQAGHILESLCFRQNDGGFPVIPEVGNEATTLKDRSLAWEIDCKSELRKDSSPPNCQIHSPS